ncbi:MAG: hypothetical protein Q9160_003935 [Pyrenula sp. 1 TL-2023]
MSSSTGMVCSEKEIPGQTKKETNWLEQMTIHVGFIKNKALGKLLRSLLRVPYCIASPVSPRFTIDVATGKASQFDTLAQRSAGAAEVISGQEIPAQSPAPKVTASSNVLREINLGMYLNFQEFQTLMSLRMGEWQMVKNKEKFRWDSPKMHLCWEKLQSEAVGNPQQESLRTGSQGSLLFEELANRWYGRIA